MTTQQTREEWLAGLKVGDEVAVTKQRLIVQTKVKRVTKTLIHAADRNFNRRTGRETGFDYLACEIVPITEENRKEIQRQRLVNWWRKIDPVNLPVAVLEAAHAAYTAALQAEEAKKGETKP